MKKNLGMMLLVPLVAFAPFIILLLGVYSGTRGDKLHQQTEPSTVQRVCNPSVEEVINDLEFAVNGTPHPCWLRRAADARRVGAMLREAVEK